jgi:hypothetical protein
MRSHNVPLVLLCDCSEYRELLNRERRLLKRAAGCTRRRWIFTFADFIKLIRQRHIASCAACLCAAGLARGAA